MALTPILMKCFEKLVLQHNRNNIAHSLDLHHYALRTNRSTEDAISNNSASLQTDFLATWSAIGFAQGAIFFSKKLDVFIVGKDPPAGTSRELHLFLRYNFRSSQNALVSGAVETKTGPF